ncbi:DUF554 family protein [Clostridium sp. MCC353]|nr:DUF554 family protein [Clostridium sp. MCC353]
MFGVFGVFTEGLSGDSSILISKSVLDFCTAFIFASTLGITVSFIVIPQIFIFLALFFLSHIIEPMITSSVLMDFMACGGILTIAAGLRIAKIKAIPIADMIPALILIIPLSFLWK